MHPFSTSSAASCFGVLCISFVFAQVFRRACGEGSIRTKPGVNLSRRRLGRSLGCGPVGFGFSNCPILFIAILCVQMCDSAYVSMSVCVCVCALYLPLSTYVSMQCLWCFFLFLTTCTDCGIFWLVLRFNCVLRMLHTAKKNEENRECEKEREWQRERGPLSRPLWAIDRDALRDQIVLSNISAPLGAIYHRFCFACSASAQPLELFGDFSAFAAPRKPTVPSSQIPNY